MKEKMLNLDLINIEATMKLTKNEKFQRYLLWLKTNGAIFKGIQFPSVFGKAEIIGIAALEDLPPCHVFLSIFLLQ